MVERQLTVIHRVASCHVEALPESSNASDSNGGERLEEAVAEEVECQVSLYRTVSELSTSSERTGHAWATFEKTIWISAANSLTDQEARPLASAHSTSAASSVTIA